jgi:2-C-methyl-D-erythritol 4-phosphate cytidylyltransferase
LKSAIILAGGDGTRFNGKKQFVSFRGKPLWKHVYDKAIDLVDEIVVVGVDTEPGKTRSGSVKNGISKLSSSSERVIILEAARPLVTKAQIMLLVNEGSNSCSFYMPLVETIIIDGHIYPDRDKCLSFQTPQAFKTRMLAEAYSSGQFDNMTDETRVIYEFFGERPKLFLGGLNLMKITYPNDLEILELIVEKGKIDVNN